MNMIKVFFDDLKNAVEDLVVIGSSRYFPAK